MTTVLVETAGSDGRVVLAVTAPDGAGIMLDMETDEARDLVNQLGAAIKDASRTGAMT